VKRLPIFLLFLGLATTTLAAPRDSMPSIYEVEVVVLQNNLPDLEGGELWSQDRVNTDIADLDKAVQVKDVPDPDSDLSKALANLDADSSYRVLFHKRWVEEARPEGDAELIRINSDDGELNGTLKFYLSRFLHLDVNLLMQESDPAALLQADTTPGVLSYRISQERRIRSEDVQYFDHPKFGALIQVKPLMTDRR
jgi:hypothetical protein